MQDWFSSFDSLLLEADKLLGDQCTRDQERRMIMRFYNGQPLMSEEEAEEQGIDSLINHLFGWSSMSKAAGRIEAPLQQPTTWRLEFPYLPIEHRGHWEAEATRKLNQIIHESDRLTTEIRSIAGEATLNGSGCLIHKNLTCWWPTFMDPLVPHGTKATRDSIPYFIVPSYLTRLELENSLRQSKKSGSNWNGEACAYAIDALKASTMSPGNTGTGNTHNATQGVTPSETQSAELQGTDVSTMRRLQLPVYQCYISNPSKEGNPWDLVVVPRYTDHQKAYILKKHGGASQTGTALYHGKGIFRGIHQILHELFLESNIGGELMWHSAIGMGRLAFESDNDFESGFNAMQTSIKETMTRMYKVSQGADRESIQRFLSEQQNLIPEGVDVVEMGHLPNYQHIIGAMTMLSNQSRRLASAATGGSDEFSKELQVQAMERQQEQQEMMTRRMSNVYGFYRRLGTEIVRRFFAAPAIEDTEGYDDIQEFRTFMKGLVGDEVFKKLAEEKGGKLKNVCVKVVRAAGDGDTIRAVNGNRFLLSQAHRFSADAQQTILRNAVQTETGNAELAEQLVPRQPDTDGIQEAVAMAENAAAAQFGLTGMSMPLNKTDIDMRQIPIHLQGLQAYLAKGKAMGWTPEDYAAFMALGSHSAAHIQKIEMVPEQKELATALMQQLQQISRQGQEYANNMRAAAEAEKLSPVDQHKMSLDERKLALETRKQVALETSRAAAQNHREREAASRNTLEAERLAAQEVQASRQQDLEAIKVAEKITQPNGKKPVASS